MEMSGESTDETTIVGHGGVVDEDYFYEAICRDGVWRLASGNHQCFMDDVYCDKGTCFRAVNTDPYTCYYKTCAATSDCGSASLWCDSGVCCKTSTCNVGGRCMDKVVEQGRDVKICKLNLVFPSDCSAPGSPCPVGYVCNAATKSCYKSGCPANGCAWNGQLVCSSTTKASTCVTDAGCFKYKTGIGLPINCTGCASLGIPTKCD